MNHKTFFWFFFPTALAMILFIALPLTSIVSQSFHAPHEEVLLVAEICDPFGCETESTIDHQATEQLKQDKPLGRWVGFEIYADRQHLAFKEVAQFWQSRPSFTGFISSLNNLPFYRAMGFTLTYVIVVTPLVILFGLIIFSIIHMLLDAKKKLDRKSVV